jgi:membrane-associated phospholipid phosphatase
MRNDKSDNREGFESRSRRALWVIIVIVILALYFLINRLVSNGRELSFPVDQYTPLIPVFIVPYLFGTFVFIIFPIWAAIYVKLGEFEAYVISILTATLVSYLIYIFFPTFVARPEIVSQDVWFKLLTILYQTDKFYNAVPSGHTFYTLVSVLYLARWKPRGMTIWIILGALIIASTLFTHQHHVIDVITGLTLGILSYYWGLLIQRKWNLKFAS